MGTEFVFSRTTVLQVQLRPLNQITSTFVSALCSFSVCIHYSFFPHERWTFIFYACFVLAVPLYQDYCQHTGEDLLGEGSVPEPITSQSCDDLPGEGSVPEPKAVSEMLYYILHTAY